MSLFLDGLDDLGGGEVDGVVVDVGVLGEECGDELGRSAVEVDEAEGLVELEELVEVGEVDGEFVHR